MPYVEVWVEEENCSGECSGAVSARQERDELQARVDEAERHLRSGHPDAALHALTDDPAMGIKRPDAIASDYKLWKAGRLPGFVPPEVVLEQNKSKT